MTPESEPAKPRTSSEIEPLKDALRKIPIFADLSEEQLDWFARTPKICDSASGEILIREGDPADALIVMLEGEMRGSAGKRRAGPPIFIVHAGQVTGMLPFSRLTVFPLACQAFGPTRIARLHKDHFPEMMRANSAADAASGRRAGGSDSRREPG